MSQFTFCSVSFEYKHACLNPTQSESNDGWKILYKSDGLQQPRQVNFLEEYRVSVTLYTSVVGQNQLKRWALTFK